MTPKEAAQPKPTDAIEAAQEKQLTKYIEDLSRSFGQYARPDGETRRIVDHSMGDASLTDLLYQSRHEA